MRCSPRNTKAVDDHRKNMPISWRNILGNHGDSLAISSPENNSLPENTKNDPINAKPSSSGQSNAEPYISMVENQITLENETTPENLTTDSDIFARNNGNADVEILQFQSAQIGLNDRSESRSAYPDTRSTEPTHNSPIEDFSSMVAESSGQSSSSIRTGPSTAFDKLAFKAVASAIEDLRKKSILMVTDDKSSGVSTPYPLSGNVARFFMTDHQVANYGPNNPDMWPNIIQPEAMRQSYHPRLSMPTPPLVHQSREQFAASLPGCYAEDYSLWSNQFPRLTRMNKHKDNKVVSMLKFIVKYTDTDVNGPWVRQFLEEPLPDEISALRSMYDSLKMRRKFDAYWLSRQKQRYSSEDLRWFYKLNPINAEMWLRKQFYKLREPNKYRRKKAMWNAACAGPTRAANTVFMPYGRLSNGDLLSHIKALNPTLNHPATMNNYQPVAEIVQPATPVNQDQTFGDWIKNSGANLSVTISYAWNELMEDGVMRPRFTPEAHQAELLSSLQELETMIQTYGTDNQKVISQDRHTAVLYAGVVLRFTQALHDYLETKDHSEAMSGGLGSGMVEREQCHGDLLRSSSPFTDGCSGACYKCRAAWSDGTEACTCGYCNTELKDHAKLLEHLAERTSRTLEPEMGSDYEKTKRALQYLDKIVDEGMPSCGLGFANENAGVLPDETRITLIRSARLRSYEKRRSKHRSSSGRSPDISQSASGSSSREGSPAPSNSPA